MILLACDLDNTLIHSHAGADTAAAGLDGREGAASDGQEAAAPEVCVEYYNGEPLCFMSAEAYGLFAALGADVSLVPVTARSVAQYQRVSLFAEHVPRFAVTSCGATILKDGEVDAAWQEAPPARVRAAAAEMRDVFGRLGHDKRLSLVRVVDSSFVFARGEGADEALRSLPVKAYAGKLNLIRHGKKLYALPCGIDKGAALAAVRGQFGADCLLAAAGDSELDIPFLDRADVALVPSPALAALVHAPRVLVQDGDFAASVLRYVSG